MTSTPFFNALRASSSISWKQTGKIQQTLASVIEKSGTALHSGALSTAKLLPAKAGEGRFFICGDRRSRIPASIDFVTDTTLCTTLCKDGARIRTVEHLLSALEGTGVDNCRIEIDGSDEVPLLDGSAQEWVEAIEKAGLCMAKDSDGNSMEKMAPFLQEPVRVWNNDSFIAAFPSSKVHITYGIAFPQVPAIGYQWFSSFPLDDSFYVKQIASSRTFCIYEEVERLRKAGLIQGGSADNAIVCSASKGWMNPPLRFEDEPCRHKVLDLVGDFSLFAQNGNQGLPVAHIVAYKPVLCFTGKTTFLGEHENLFDTHGESLTSMHLVHALSKVGGDRFQLLFLPFVGGSSTTTGKTRVSVRYTLHSKQDF